MPTPPKLLGTERVVSADRVAFQTRALGVDGQFHVVEEVADRGETVVLDAVEMARLDSLGCLAAVGMTAADVEAEVQAKKDAYQAARRELPTGWGAE